MEKKMRVRMLTEKELKRENIHSWSEALELAIQKWYNLWKCRREAYYYLQGCGLCNYYDRLNKITNCPLRILQGDHCNSHSNTIWQQWHRSGISTIDGKLLAKRMYKLLCSFRGKI